MSRPADSCRRTAYFVELIQQVVGDSTKNHNDSHDLSSLTGNDEYRKLKTKKLRLNARTQDGDYQSSRMYPRYVPLFRGVGQGVA
jgi:hypothetical protein